MKYALIIIGLIIIWVGIIFVIAPEKSGIANKKLLEPKTSDIDSVTIIVAPREISENLDSWEFKIEMNTHSYDLKENLVSISTLIIDEKNSYKPIGWLGDPTGGHHREGILKFNQVEFPTRSIELVISGIGGEGERRFKWLIAP